MDSTNALNSSSSGEVAPPGTQTVVHGYTAFSGYTGASGNDIKCGGFSSATDIADYCNARSNCGGFSRDSEPNKPLRWWCTKSTRDKGNRDSFSAAGVVDTWYQKNTGKGCMDTHA